MEQFLDGHHVRLRSLELGTYLHAAADGIDVRLDPDRASVNSAWTVHLRQGDHANDYLLLLHSVAFGRYLAAATNARAPWGQRGFRVEQREFDEPEVGEIMWQVIRPGSFVLLRHVSARLLHHNGRRRFNWNSGVTVGNFENMSTMMMMMWVVEPIPPSQVYPGVPAPLNEPLSSPQFVCSLFGREPPPLRVIRFKRANANGTFNDDGLIDFQFRGNSSYRLMYQLILRLDIVDFIMCVRAGHYARLTPMIANLPRGTGNTLYIVLIDTITPGGKLACYCGRQFHVELGTNQNHHKTLSYPEDVEQLRAIDVGRINYATSPIMKCAAISNPLFKCHSSSGYKTAVSPCNGQKILQRFFSKKAKGFCSPIDQIKIGNEAFVCIDETENELGFLENYKTGIGEMRYWCYRNGHRIDVSTLFGANSVIYTAPGRGSFNLNLLSKKRVLRFPLLGDLYLLGWEGGPNGAFCTLNSADILRRECQMEAKVLPFKENYNHLWPGGNLGKIPTGPIPVNFCEAARMQGPFQTVCDSTSDYTIQQLDSRDDNSPWLTEYGNYSNQVGLEVSCRLSGKTPPAIDVSSSDGKVVRSTSDILSNIQVLLRSDHLVHIPSLSAPLYSATDSPRFPKWLLEKFNSDHDKKPRAKSPASLPLHLDSTSSHINNLIRDPYMFLPTVLMRTNEHSTVKKLPLVGREKLGLGVFQRKIFHCACESSTLMKFLRFVH